MMWIWVLLLIGIAQVSWALDIPLTVAEPSSVARTAEVVTTGVPLPIGTQTTNWQLRDSTDTEIPMSFTVLPGRTPWLLVSFQTTHTSGQTKTYTLRDTAKTATLTIPLVVVEDGTSFVVTTGKVKATIMKGAAYSGLEKVIYDADANGTYADPSEVIVSAPTAFSSIVNSTDTLTYTADGNVTATSIEYNNAHRAVIRVDGQYKNGSTVWLTYTTRYTFRAGSPMIEVEHIIRNTLQANKRDAKFSSATLVVGGGTATGTATTIWDKRYFNVTTSGLSFQIMPPSPYGITTSTNGGLVLPDLSNWTTSLYLDFETGLTSPTVTARTSAARNPMMALASPRWFSDYGELSESRFSTTQDEKDANDQWGWTYNPASAPCDTQNDTAFVGWGTVDVHNDAEADDLWQNILMYLRTGGCRGYFNRARSFVRYYRDDYAYRTEGFPFAWDDVKEGPTPFAPTDPFTRTIIVIPFTAADIDYIGFNADGTAANGHAYVRNGRFDLRDVNNANGCHMFGQGLIDWYYLTGDTEAVQAAKDLGEIIERFWYWRASGYDVNVSGTRAVARHLEVTARLMEWSQGGSEESRWWALGAEISRLLINDTTSWTSFDSGTSGFYSNGEAAVEAVTGSTGYDNGARGGTMNDRALIIHSTWRYYRLIGDTTDGLIHKDRLLKMVQWTKNHAISPTVNYAANGTTINWPTTGDIWYNRFQQGSPEYRQEWQAMWINTLMIGYRLNGDATLLTLARGLWSRFSKTNDGWPPPAIPADPSPAVRWLNQSFFPEDLYTENCCMVYASLLFATVVDNPPPVWSQYGGSTNIDTHGFAVGQPAIAVDSANDIYVASAQERQPSTFGANGVHCSKIDVSKLVSESWVHLGTPLGHPIASGQAQTCDSWGPSITTIGTTPYAAWHEVNAFLWGNGIESSCFVSQWNGTSWVALTGNRTNGSLAVGALNSTECKYPQLANVGGVLYVATIEDIGTTAQIVVWHWTGSAWVQDGTGFQSTVGTGTFIQDMDILDVGGIPHVVWSEWRQTGSSTWVNNVGVVKVKKLSAGAWVDVGTALSSTTVNQYIAATVIGSTPYVAWVERTATGPNQLFVKHFNGTSWVADGGVQNVNATTGRAGRPALTTDGTDLWLAWSEYTIGQQANVYVRKLAVSSGIWHSEEGPLNTHTNTTARSVAMTAKSGIPQLIWNEKHETSHTAHTYLFARDGNGTGTETTATLWHAGGTLPSPVVGSWISVTPGGIVANGGVAVTDEGFNNFSWVPALGMGVVYGKYHTFPSGSSGETQQALMGWHYDTNRWELLDVGDANGGEHMPGSGHTQGLDLILPDGRWFTKGNHTLNDKIQFRSKVYDLIAGHGELLRPATEMPGYAEGTCALDPSRNQILCLKNTTTETWMYNITSNTWTTRAVGPGLRAWAGMAFDTHCDCYVAFGGENGGHTVTFGDTWEYFPATNVWVLQTPSPTPGPRYGPYMAYDANAQRVVMTGGGSNETWLYNSITHTWAQIANAPVATGTKGARLVFVPEKNVLLLYQSPTAPIHILRLVDISVPPSPTKLQGTTTLSGNVHVQ